MSGTKSNSVKAETKRWKIALLNGLNMTNLGLRDKNVYGTIGSLQELEDLVSDTGAMLGVDIISLHSNHEGDLVDFIEEDTSIDAFMINPGGLWAFGAPTKLALVQAEKPFVEVHFANIFATGHLSVFTDRALGTIMGFRHYGYLGALVGLVAELNQGPLRSR
ncbi:MAG: dehydroquinase [Gammaproteobacteria bacterium]|nr:MAG: dehydroquinase [Gammaproteobacteria bacterium]